MTYDPQHPTQPEPVIPLEPASDVAGAASPAPSLVRPGPVPPVTKGGGSGRWLNVVLAFAVLIAVGGVAFAVGRTTAPETAAATTGRFGGGGQFPIGSGAPAFGNGGNGGQGGFAGFGRGNGVTVTGMVDSIDGDTMTISTTDGRSVTVTLDADTTYSTKSAASSSDVTTGSTVEVQMDLAGAFRGGAGGDDDSAGNGAANGQTPAITASGVTIVP